MGKRQTKTGTVFENNRTQAVRLPAEVRFPEGVVKVHVRVVGAERVLTPVDSLWDSFFDKTCPQFTDDFLPDRATQNQPERDSFDD